MEVGDFPLKDKVVVVTGGGSGICASFVQRAADAGAKVLVADLQLTPDAQKLVDGSDNVLYQKTDVTKWDELHRLVTVAKEKFGSTPDVYVAGAGVYEPAWTQFWKDPEKERYANVDINVNHPIKLTRIALEALVSENRKGVVISIASVGGLTSAYHCPLYIATKHAIVGFTRSMKLAEKYEGVKIVTICPGAVDTPLWTQDKRDRSNFQDIESLTPDEVAKVMIEMVETGKYGGGTVLEIMPNNGPKTRIVPEWNIDAPQGGTTTNFDPNSKEIPQTFREAKGAMDSVRGTAGKGGAAAKGHKKKISISQKSPGLWQAEEIDDE